jgi:FkbM family methyltransferase
VIGDSVEYVTSGQAGEMKVAKIFEQKISKESCKKRYYRGDTSSVLVTRNTSDLLPPTSFKHFPKTAGVVLDIGANIGIYGMYSGVQKCLTFMFDAQPICQRYLRAGIKENRISQNAFVVPFPVGDVSAPIELDNSSHCFAVYRTVTGQQDNMWKQKEQSKGSTFQAIQLRLDDFFRDAIDTGTVPRILVVKLDVEGYEHKVLLGMAQLITTKAIDDMIVELSPRFWDQFGFNRSEVAHTIVSILWDQGGLTNVTMFGNGQETDMTILDRRHLLSTIETGIPSGQNDFHFQRAVQSD